MKKKENYLDIIYGKNEIDYHKDDENMVVLHIERKSLYDKIKCRIGRSKRITYISFDDFGTYVWDLIDGTTSVDEIGKMIFLQYGEEINPLYPRLVSYLNVLYRNHWIKMIS